MVRDEYLALLRAKGACEPAIHFAGRFDTSATAEEITQAYLESNRDESWALWALQNIYEDAPELRRLWIDKVRDGDNRRLLLLWNLIPGLTKEDRMALEVAWKPN